MHHVFGTEVSNTPTLPSLHCSAHPSSVNSTVNSSVNSPVNSPVKSPVKSSPVSSTVRSTVRMTVRCKCSTHVQVRTVSQSVDKYTNNTTTCTKYPSTYSIHTSTNSPTFTASLPNIQVIELSPTINTILTHRTHSYHHNAHTNTRFFLYIIHNN